MAKKYLKYVVTREDQSLYEDFDIFCKEFNGKNLLNIGNKHAWNLHQMIQKIFFCNWPNTNFRKYFVKAETCILNTGDEIKQISCNNNPDNYFGYLCVNSDNKTNINFTVYTIKESINLESKLLLISPSNYETHSIQWGETFPLLLIKINIIPAENIKNQFDWTPL